MIVRPLVRFYVDVNVDVADGYPAKPRNAWMVRYRRLRTPDPSCDPTPVQHGPRILRCTNGSGQEAFWAPDTGAQYFARASNPFALRASGHPSAGVSERTRSRNFRWRNQDAPTCVVDSEILVGSTCPLGDKGDDRQASFTDHDKDSPGALRRLRMLRHWSDHRTMLLFPRAILSSSVRVNSAVTSEPACLEHADVGRSLGRGEVSLTHRELLSAVSRGSKSLQIVWRQARERNGCSSLPRTSANSSRASGGSGRGRGKLDKLSSQ